MSALKNIWEPSGSKERKKNVDSAETLRSLSLYTAGPPASSRPALPPPSPKKTQSRGGRVASVREEGVLAPLR